MASSDVSRMSSARFLLHSIFTHQWIIWVIARLRHEDGAIFRALEMFGIIEIHSSVRAEDIVQFCGSWRKRVVSVDESSSVSVAALSLPGTGSRWVSLIMPQPMLTNRPQSGWQELTEWSLAVSQSPTQFMARARYVCSTCNESREAQQLAPPWTDGSSMIVRYAIASAPIRNSISYTLAEQRHSRVSKLDESSRWHDRGRLRGCVLVGNLRRDWRDGVQPCIC